MYTFLQSAAGQFLVKRSRSGSVIESIYESDVSSLLVPLLPAGLRERLTELVEEFGRLRVEANRLLTTAEAEVQRQCGLPCLDDSAREANGLSCHHYVLPAKAVRAETDAREYHRLDATYYDPAATHLREAIARSNKFVSVSQAATKVVLIPKTFVEGVHKVEKDYGTPYFTGKELFRTRLSPETYITSSNERLISRLVVEHETTLVTCAGTVGRVMYVHSNLEGYTVTHDAIRIHPNGILAPGFLYAFLSSPYGQMQIQRCSYGSVIPRLYRTHIENVLISKPDDNGEGIAALVDEAFRKRHRASLIEVEAISLFETAVREGKEATEAKWGREY